jgi:hypothetical protein
MLLEVNINYRRRLVLMLKQLRRRYVAGWNLSLWIVMALAVSFTSATAYADSPQSPDDAPSRQEFSILSTMPAPRNYFEGEHLRIRISPTAHFGDARADGGYVGVGFQYPIGYEHAAVAWWGEGFTFGYTANGIPFYSTSYDSYPGHRNLLFVTDGVVRGESNGDNTKEAVYGSILRTVDARVELVHRFLFPRDKKFVILTVTIKNISQDTLSNVRYRRIWDFDMDNTVNSGDRFNIDVGRHMLYAGETHYAALAASSSTPPTDWDIWAWDDIDTYLPGPRIEKGPFPPDGVAGDYNVRLEWVYNTLAPGESKQIVMYFIGGDNKADLDVSYKQANEFKPFGLTCTTGADYPEFGADTFYVDLVCPAYKDNFGTTEEGPLHPNNTAISLYLVIHTTGGDSIQAAISQFRRRGSQVSAQYIIGPNGEIVQMVSESRSAYHPGYTHLWEEQEINRWNSIGIEHVGDSSKATFQPTEAMYQASARLIADIILRAQNLGKLIAPNRWHIIGHEEVSGYNTARRQYTAKIDPGPQWDWNRFMTLIPGGSNDLPTLTLLEAKVLEKTRGRVTVLLKWSTKANAREGFRIWRRTGDGSYDISRPLRISRGSQCLGSVKLCEPSQRPKGKRVNEWNWEITSQVIDNITLPPSGTVVYCYSVWAYRFANNLNTGYYGGPINEEKLRSREICTDPISSMATGVTNLSIENIAVASQGKALKFVVIGQDIEDIFVSVFDLSGRQVFDSGKVQGNTLNWSLQNNVGQPLANGVYLYVVRVRGFDGQEYVSEVRKLVILR